MELGARHPQEFEVGCGVWPLVSHHPDPSGPAGTPFQVLPVLLWAGHLVPWASPCLFPCQRTHRVLSCRPFKIFYHSWHCHSASWDPGSVPMGFPRRGPHCHCTMGGTECYETVASAVWGFGELRAPALL